MASSIEERAGDEASAGFVGGYYSALVEAIERFDRGPLERAIDLLDRVRASGGTLFTAGNGGSAAIAEHFVCDATKGTAVPGVPPLRSHSLGSNASLLTALANDLAYEEVFRQPLEWYARPGDVLLLISSSGNSPNVVAACRAAIALGLGTIAFVGFEGGRLRELADCVVWVPVQNYGIVEDVHQSLLHCATQCLRERAERRTELRPAAIPEPGRRAQRGPGGLA